MTALGIDEGLAHRLRATGASIVWRPVRRRSPSGGGRTLRVARLRDEEATVEVRAGGAGVTVEVDAGPLGAVILLAEADRRGPPSSLGSRNGRRGSPFPQGSIVAAWGDREVPADARPSLRDLVDLARYALP